MASTAEQIQRAVETLPPAVQQKVLQFVRSLAQARNLDDAAIGEIGARLAAEVWPVEDFSDWLRAPPPRQRLAPSV